MKKLSAQIFILSLPFILYVPSQTYASEPHQPAHWSYKGHGNPAQWAKLNPEFETCATGLTQSPINIQQAIKANLPSLEFQYQETVPSIVNNGHTIQINLAKGNSLKVGEQQYELLQFHFEFSIHLPTPKSLANHSFLNFL